MMQMVLVGLGAGLATALLFASIASGVLLSIPLFYLAPLPILIAALGWSHWSALIAAVSAAGGLALVLGPFFFLAFLVGVGLPAWWLGYLGLLARSEPSAPGIEWFPAGRLVLWAAMLAALVVVMAIPNFGLDEESFRTNLRAAFERVLQNSGQNIPGMDKNRVLDLMTAIVPLAAAVLATITNSMNLYLAGRIVNVSGRLRRPWPDIPGMQFPAFAPALLAIAIAGSFLPNLIGSVAAIVSCALLMAYGWLGFAVLHVLTANNGARAFLLAAAYAAVLFFVWPLLPIILLGLADTILNLRGRVSRPHPPAPPMN